MEEQLENTESRLQTLRTLMQTEEQNLLSLRQSKTNIQSEIAQSEAAIQQLQEELKEVAEELEEKTKIVDQVKRTASRAAKGLDQVLKEIATAVRTPDPRNTHTADLYFGNRTMRLKNSDSSDPPFIADAAWMRFIYHFFQAI